MFKPSISILQPTNYLTLPSPVVRTGDSGFVKYGKMRQMLPEAGLRQRMMLDGLNQEEVDAFFSTTDSFDAPSSFESELIHITPFSTPMSVSTPELYQLMKPDRKSSLPPPPPPDPIPASPSLPFTYSERKLGQPLPERPPRRKSEIITTDKQLSLELNDDNTSNPIGQLASLQKEISQLKKELETTMDFEVIRWSLFVIRSILVYISDSLFNLINLCIYLEYYR